MDFMNKESSYESISLSQDSVFKKIVPNTDRKKRVRKKKDKDVGLNIEEPELKRIKIIHMFSDLCFV